MRLRRPSDNKKPAKQEPKPQLAPTAELDRRVAALSQAADLSRPYLPEEDVNGVLDVVAKAGDRLRHGTNHTVVAIAGATGSGKSSIVNRLAGAELSTSSVRRPTTSTTHAAVWGPTDAEPLLDWLEIQRRHRVENSASELDGLILLDLPDHDSTAVEHRIEVDRLVQLVDVLLWVTDPQKYADEALHAGYIQPLTGHADILRFVLNQVDRVQSDRALILDDLHKLLISDGIPNPQVLAVSAATGEGFDNLKQLLAGSVADRRVVVDRLNADLEAAATVLRRSGGRVDTKGRERQQLIRGLGEAAGANEIAGVAAAHHRRKGLLRAGWPFTRFVRRLRRRPLSDLPGPGRAPAAEARSDLAIRDFAEGVSNPLEVPWPAAVRSAASSQRSKLLDEIRSVVGSAAVGQSRSPLWWSAVAWIQRLFAGAAIVGIVWLVVVSILGGFFQFETEPLLPPTPEYDWIPLPSTLAIGGIILGLVLSLLVRIPLSLAANRRGRKARKAVEASVETIADTYVIKPVDELISQQQQINRLLDEATRRE